MDEGEAARRGDEKKRRGGGMRIDGAEAATRKGDERKRRGREVDRIRGSPQGVSNQKVEGRVRAVGWQQRSQGGSGGRVEERRRMETRG